MVRQFIEEMIPFHRFLGLKVDHLEPGLARLKLPFRPEFVGDPFRPALHGGVLSTLLDTVGGMAVFTRLPWGDRASTVDMRVDYLRPGLNEDLVAEGRVERLGNRVGVTEMRVFHPGHEAEPVATGRGVYNIRRSDQGGEGPVPDSSGLPEGLPGA
ncbi:MAG: hotdog fold thioesterase [Deltaproteobacteria bacterium]|nr:hotdog fold thioesterase [Deltaproteobacteria bacterium]